MGGNGDGKIIFASFFSALFDNVDKIEIRVYDICPNVTTTAKKTPSTIITTTAEIKMFGRK